MSSSGRAIGSIPSTARATNGDYGQYHDTRGVGGGRSRAEHIEHVGARQPTSTEHFAYIFRALEKRAISQ